MYKPCAVTARPISGSGTRGDLGDGEWQVAEGGSNCRCGDRVRLIQGAQWFFQCCREADYADYTSVLDIHLHFHHNCLQSCPLYSPLSSPLTFFSLLHSHSLSLNPISSRVPFFYPYIHHYPFYLFSVPRPPQTPPPASAPPPILAEPANNQTASFSSTQANTYFCLRSSLCLIQPLWPFL